MRNLLGFIAFSGCLNVALAAPLTGITPGVATGSLNHSRLPASSQYVLRSTVLEQLRSHGVPTMEVSTAPYVYLAQVGFDTVEKGCIYHVTATLVPNETDSDRKSLWARDFSSNTVSCDQVSVLTTQTLDRFATEFSNDAAKGLIRDDRPVAAQK